MGTKGSIWIEAKPANDDFIEVRVLDSAQAFRSSASKWDSFLYPPASPTDLALGYRYVTRFWRRMGAGFGWNNHSDGASVRFTLPIAK